MNITEEEIRTIKDCLGTTKDYIDYPHTHNGTTRLRKANNKAIELVNNLSQHLVSKRELTGDDLIEFSIWLIGKSYEHRLAILPNDLVDYYLKNRDSIIENNNVC